MEMVQLDHIVLTLKDINTSVEFYENILNMKKEIFNGDRVALKFANQKINLYQMDTDTTPKAKHPTS